MKSKTRKALERLADKTAKRIAAEFPGKMIACGLDTGDYNHKDTGENVAVLVTMHFAVAIDPRAMDLCTAYVTPQLCEHHAAEAAERARQAEQPTEH